jgi:hypothetical protein
VTTVVPACFHARMSAARPWPTAGGRRG